MIQLVWYSASPLNMMNHHTHHHAGWIYNHTSFNQQLPSVSSLCRPYLLLLSHPSFQICTIYAYISHHLIHTLILASKSYHYSQLYHHLPIIVPSFHHPSQSHHSPNKFHHPISCTPRSRNIRQAWSVCTNGRWWLICHDCYSYQPKGHPCY